MNHLYIKKDIVADSTFIELCAQKYIDCRGKLAADPLSVCQQPGFANTGFSIDNVKDVINKYIIPKRPANSSTKHKHLDIYRSDLGELLMTVFFEEELARQTNDDGTLKDSDGNFTIPLKNIWDREINDSPGRGIDGIGYRINASSRTTLLLGESKVSSENQHPPQVVHAKEDSIYKTHKLHLEDKDYLLRKLTNHCKKVDTEDAVVYYVLMMYIEEEDNDSYDVVYGCCMVRDSNCVKVDEDYGKLMTKSSDFEPNSVYFYIPSFDKSIDEVGELFYEAVQRLAKK